MAMTGNTGEHLRIPGLVAAADLSAKQYHIVTLATTAKQVKVAAAATGGLVGVLQNDPLAGEAASVVCAGMTKVVTAGSVTIGALLTANSTGQATVTTTANNSVVGRALTAATTAGDLCEILVSLSNL